MTDKTYTTISLATFYGLDGKARGERVRDLLRSDLREASIGNDVNLAPIGGGFALTITTTYVFTDDDGQPVEDNEKRLYKFMASVLTEVLTGALCREAA